MLAILMCSPVTSDSAPTPTTAQSLPACADPKPGLHIIKGDTLGEISTRMTQPHPTFSFGEWADLIYTRNQHAFKNNKDQLITGKILYFPCSGPEENIHAETAVTDQVGAPVAAGKPSQDTAVPSPAKKLPLHQKIQEKWPNFYIAAVLGVVSLLALLIIALSFYFYRWSRTFSVNSSSKKFSTASKEDFSQLATIEKILNKLHTQYGEDMVRLVRNNADSAEKMTGLQKTFLTLKSMLDERDSEIRRLKKGYDAQVFRKFLIRFIRVDQAVDEFLQDNPAEREALDVIKNFLEDALDACGVQHFSPQIGEDYRRAEGVGDFPKKSKTENPEKNYKIAEILQKGYRIQTPEGHEIVYHAKVRIFTSN